MYISKKTEADSSFARSSCTTANTLATMLMAGVVAASHANEQADFSRQSLVVSDLVEMPMKADDVLWTDAKEFGRSWQGRAAQITLPVGEVATCGDTGITVIVGGGLDILVLDAKKARSKLYSANRFHLIAAAGDDIGDSNIAFVNNPIGEISQVSCNTSGSYAIITTYSSLPVLGLDHYIVDFTSNRVVRFAHASMQSYKKSITILSSTYKEPPRLDAGFIDKSGENFSRFNLPIFGKWVSPDAKRVLGTPVRGAERFVNFSFQYVSESAVLKAITAKHRLDARRTGVYLSNNVNWYLMQPVIDSTNKAYKNGEFALWNSKNVIPFYITSSRLSRSVQLGASGITVGVQNKSSQKKKYTTFKDGNTIVQSVRSANVASSPTQSNSLGDFLVVDTGSDLTGIGLWLQKNSSPTADLKFCIGTIQCHEDGSLATSLITTNFMPTPGWEVAHGENQTVTLSANLGNSLGFVYFWRSF
jgi:hypothetical protein